MEALVVALTTLQDLARAMAGTNMFSDLAVVWPPAVAELKRALLARMAPEAEKYIEDTIMTTFTELHTCLKSAVTQSKDHMPMESSAAVGAEMIGDIEATENHNRRLHHQLSVQRDSIPNVCGLNVLAS